MTPESGTDDRVSIRADLPERVARLEEQVQANRREMEQGFRHRDQALTLQHKEYERRLEDLNHENARILEAAAKSVNIDVYEADKKATALALSVAKEQLDASRGGALGRRELWAGLVATVTVIAVVVGAVVTLS